ncbi:MAG: peptide-methionine (S)-S-oxide reductase MsrA [Thermoplasmata archaeon]
MSTAVATLGGGCFWCTDAVFRELAGVVSVEPGFAGGTVLNPSYEDVCTGATGHAEVTQVRFRPAELDYRDLLRIFFTVHDPTTLNRQGGDVGTQYRSLIFYHDETQHAIATEVIREIEAAKIWRRPIVTEVVPFTVFYPAEEYHRDYFVRHPERAYCQAIIAPKVAKFRKHYATRLRPATT